MPSWPYPSLSASPPKALTLLCPKQTYNCHSMKPPGVQRDMPQSRSNILSVLGPYLTYGCGPTSSASMVLSPGGHPSSRHSSLIQYAHLSTKRIARCVCGLDHPLSSRFAHCTGKTPPAVTLTSITSTLSRHHCCSNCSPSNQTSVPKEDALCFLSSPRSSLLSLTCPLSQP